jgi:hypothetical protein
MSWDSKLLPDKVLRLLSPADRRSLGKAGLTAEEAVLAGRIKAEKDLQNLMESYFNLRGIVAIRSRMDKATRTKTGTPDFLLAIRGRAIAVEAKLPGKDLEEDQQSMKAKMMAAPNNWHWVTAYSMDTVKNLVQTFEELRPLR